MTDKESFLANVQALAESVHDFHERFEMPKVCHSEDPDHFNTCLSKRVAQLMEEVGEHCADLNKDNPDNAVLEAADIAFVALGTLVTFGHHGADAAKKVAQKNNSKTLETHMIDPVSGKLVKRHTEA